MRRLNDAEPPVDLDFTGWERASDEALCNFLSEIPGNEYSEEEVQKDIAEAITAVRDGG